MGGGGVGCSGHVTHDGRESLGHVHMCDCEGRWEVTVRGAGRCFGQSELLECAGHTAFQGWWGGGWLRSHDS